MPDYNPATGKHRWKLSHDWHVSYEYHSDRSQTKRCKRLGQITRCTYTSKGKVDGKANVCMLIASTSKQDEDHLPYGFAISKLDHSELQKQYRNALEKGNGTVDDLTLASKFCS